MARVNTEALFIDNRKDGYETYQCGYTMTVRELVEYLTQKIDDCELDEDMPVFINNGEYTYSSIDEDSFFVKDCEIWRDDK